MNYYLKQGAQEAYLKIGTLISDAGATAQIFAISDNPKLVFKKFRDPEEARRMEAKISQMVNNLPSDDLKEIGAGSLSIHSLAWPTHCVYAHGQFAGFLMPYIDHCSSVSLNKIFSSKSRQKNGITEDLRWRIYVARNLVAVYHTLHQAGYFVVDTKPANIRTYKDSPAVSILDCDGFRHQSDNSASGFITEEYIAPSSIGKPFSELGGEQDLFAVSILVFQILNNGIHPFQGIQSSSSAYTTQELIGRRAYPYGEQRQLILKPSPISAHSLFPDELRAYFDKVFLGRSKAKSVKGLLQILDDMKDGNGLAKCSKLGHYAFVNGCPSCFVENLSAKPKNARQGPASVDLSKQSPSTSSSPPTINAASQAPSSQSGTAPFLSGLSTMGWLFFGALIMIGFAIAVSSNSRQSSASVTKHKTISGVSTGELASLGDHSICVLATVGRPDVIRWSELASNVAYVDEAKKRSLACGVPMALTISELCRVATINGQWRTGADSQQYILEARRRGSDCTVETPVARGESGLSNNELCERATIGGEGNLLWRANSSYVDAAKERGLACGVAESYSGKELCRLATRAGQWESQPKYLQYVREAKRRGIQCGVLLANTDSGTPDLVVSMSFRSQWQARRINGACRATAQFTDGSALTIEKITPGNFNIKYRMTLQLKGYFDAMEQQLLFDLDNAVGITIAYPASVDPDSSLITFDGAFARKLQNANSLFISSARREISYKFPLIGTKASINAINEGKCL